jgi:hypothetical protein
MDVARTTPAVHDAPRSGRRPNGTGRAVAITALLVASAALLAVGIATQSAVAWFGGGLPFIASFGFDDRRL